VRIETVTEIACTPERLWPFLEEPEKQKLWMKGLLENTRSGEGPGSTFHMKIKEGGRVAEYDGEVTDRDPPRHLAVRLRGGAMPAGMVVNVDYRLTDLHGRTRLDYAAQMTSDRRLSLFLRLLMPLIRLFGKRQLKRFLKKLKQLAEAPVEQPAV
jgi:carbon monoxide dehydrogenase subunit G